MSFTLVHRYGIRLLLVTALLCAGSPSVAAQAQAGTGQIVGTVYDSTGALVPQAKVTLKSKDIGLTREDTASDEGQYRFILLPVGFYTVTFNRTGFKTYKADVEVSVGSAVTVNAKLELGEVSQVVEVSATPVVETTVATSGALISTKAIENLPINGRRFQEFATLTPRVQIEPQRSGISFAGQRGINGNITVDGVDYNEPFFGGIRGGERGSSTFTLPQEAISQFQVVSHGYSAEFGRSTGGILNAVTKSGSNEWHGSAFYFNRNGSLSKKDALNRKAVTDLQQFGGSVGGPVIRDKTFFFFAYEQQINNNPRVVIFRRLDPITPTAGQLEAFCFFRVIPACPSGSTGLESPFTQTNDSRTFLIRGDQQLGANHRVSGRYHYSKNRAKNAVATGDAISPETNRTLESNGTEGDDTDTVTGQWTAIFSPRVVNELRGTYSLENRPRTANALIAGFNSSIGDTGTRSFLSTTLDDWRVQVADSLNWTLGKHTVKFGGEFNYLSVDQLFKFNQFGLFTFTTTTTSTVLDILSRDPANANDHRFDNSAVRYNLNIGNGLVKYTGKELAFFVLDTWRITPRFTLTAGFRWEGYLNPEPETNNASLLNRVQNIAFPIGRRVDPTKIPDNLRQYMPRVGLAWDPWGNSKTVIRASAGIYYARTPLLLYAGPLNNFRDPAGDLTVQLPFTLTTGATIPNCAAVGLTPLGTGDNCNTVYWQMRRIGINLDSVLLGNLPLLTPQLLLQVATALNLTPDLFRGSQPLTWANNYESPRAFQWSVGGEHEFARGWSAGIDFVYINTVHLQRNLDLNLPTPLICTGTPLPVGCTSADPTLRPCFGVVSGGRCSQSRPVGSLSSLTLRESTARSLYRGVTFRTNFRRGRYTFQGYYTLSDNNSNDDNERSATGFNYENSFVLGNEYAPSTIDARHLFSFNGVVNLPAGFTVGALGRFRSGRPFEPVTGSDSTTSCNASPLPAGCPSTTGSVVAGNTDNNRFTDRALQAAGIPFKRNSFRDRPVLATDLRIGWDVFTALRKAGIQPREKIRLSITADFFNLFSYDNVTYGSLNQEYGVGFSSITNSVVPANVRFQRLRDSASCLSPTNLTGNKGCYDTNNNVGSPFTVQLGVRFEF